MKHLILVFIGGGLGSSLRYVLSKWLNSWVIFPLGTFTVNILGSFIIGIILGMASKEGSISVSTSMFLATGFCGGFTTFSTFSYENSIFLKSGDYLMFILYTTLSFTLGILAVFGGMQIYKHL